MGGCAVSHKTRTGECCSDAWCRSTKEKVLRPKETREVGRSGSVHKGASIYKYKHKQRKSTKQVFIILRKGEDCSLPEISNSASSSRVSPTT